MSNELPWDERVTMLSINPDAATREDVARMAADLMDFMRTREGMVGRYETFGYALAMSVLQSPQYARLDDLARAECDELIRRGQAAPSAGGEEEDIDMPFSGSMERKT